MKGTVLTFSALALALLAVTPVPDAQAQAAITNLVINPLTNRQDYFEGDSITLTGKVTDNVGNNVQGASVVVELRRPVGISVSSTLVTTASDGTFRKDMVIPFVGDPKGNYTIFMGASKNAVTGYAVLSVIVTPRFGFAGGGGGRSCIIATATYGSEFAPQVQLLRSFRDGLLARSATGAGFMAAFDSFYYSFSPYVASGVAGNPLLAHAFAALLSPLLAVLSLSYGAYAAIGAGREVSLIGAGALASSLIGLTYVAPIAEVVRIVSRNRRARLRPEVIVCVLAASLTSVALSYAFSAGWLMALATASFVVSLVAAGAGLGGWVIRTLAQVLHE